MSSEHTNRSAESPLEVSNLSTSSTASGPPPVVAVLVTCNAGPWFSETLEALRDQDYPNLSVLVIDAASAEDPLPLIARILPNGYVRRLGRNPGYAAAANRTLRVVQGASHIVFCHDDAAPSRNAVSSMMEAAIRENAGIVTPKMVDWENPHLLADLGGTIDSTGVYVPAIEPGDLDQGQHDVGGDVLVARSGFMLVRSDLFQALGGFDGAMTQFGEDVDFCLRAQLAGARIVTAPKATVRHLEVGVKGMRTISDTISPSVEEEEDSTSRAADQLVLGERHRLRMVLKTRQARRMPVTLVRLAVLAFLELLFDIVSGRGRQASAVAAAWTWNLAHWRELRRLRKQTQGTRVSSDKELDARMGSARTRIGAVLRQSWEGRRDRLSQEIHGRELAGVLRNLPVAVWGTVLVVWIVGSRHLLGGSLPAVGELVPLPGSPTDLLRTFSGTQPAVAFGEASTQSPVNLIVGILGYLFLGAMGTLHKVLVLGMLPLGVWGMSRLARHLKSPRSRLLAVLSYAIVPLPYDSLAMGRWDGLIAYAAAPFLLSRVLRTHGSAPYMARRGFLKLSFRRRRFRDEDDQFETLVVSDLSAVTAAAALHNRDEADVEITHVETGHDEPLGDRVWFLVVRRVFPMALLLGLAGGFAPQLIPATVLIGVLLLIGTLLIGERSADRLRTLGVTSAAALLATGLLFPGIIGADEGWAMFWDHVSSAQEPQSLGTLLQFHTGGFGSNLATLGIFVAALPGALLGRDWRMNLSLRLWVVTLGFVLLTWMGSREWLGPVAPDPHTFLAVAAVALCLNVGVSMLALQDDLTSYRFGWRQLMPIVVWVGVVLSVLPTASRAGDGSWDLPRVGQEALLSWMQDERDVGTFRTLWLGDPDGMPGGARQLTDDLAAAVAVNHSIPFGPARPTVGGVAQDQIAQMVERGRDGDTVRLGRLLAPHGVRYIVVPLATGPSTSGGREIPVPVHLEPMLAAQLDLRTIVTDESIVVYENTAWAPVRHMQPAPAIVASHNGDPYAAQTVSLQGVQPVLPAGGRTSFGGPLPAGQLYVGTATSDAWKLTVGGREAPHREGFGWANTYEVAQPGEAKLQYRAPVWIVSTQLAVALAWALIFLIALRHRTRRGRFS